MKLIITIISIIGVTLAIHPPKQASFYNNPRIFEKLINSTFNTAVAAIATFDPIDLEHHEHNELTYWGEINNLHVEGFSNVVATHIKLSGLLIWTLELTIEAPRILATLEHWEHHSTQFHGQGNARIEIQDLELIIKAKINPISMHVKDLKITPSIGNAEVSITGLSDDKKFSEKISDDIETILNERVNNDTEFHHRISELLLKLIQSIHGLILG